MEQEDFNSTSVVKIKVLGVGGGGGETHKNVFMGVVLYPALGLPGVAGRPVRAAAQADLPQCAQL